MRSRVTIVSSVALVLVLLAVLNAASYVRLERQTDSELMPDRSTYNGGATGTRALHDFLKESGHTVVRWRKTTAALTDGQEPVAPRTFVVVGALRREFAEEESRALLRWVAQGGRLVLVDRTPAPSLLPRSGRWQLTSEVVETPGLDVQSADGEAMVRDSPPLAPAQTTLLTRDVERVAPSRFASRLHLFALGDDETESAAGDETTDAASDDEAASEDSSTDRPSRRTAPVVQSEPPPPPAPRVRPGVGGGAPKLQSPAPVVHVARGGGRQQGGALLVDFAYERGRILVLSDPFIISNGGLSRADNLQLAVNLVTAGGGVIAFDEYHQGRSASENMTLAYFRGTPVPAMLAQALVVALAVLWTRSRRLARPLPAPYTDRRSKLEYVASMAELQQRARANDLAVENVYARTRRALARYGGAETNAPSAEIAARVAARTGRDTTELAALMRECEESIAGQPLTTARALELVAALRRWERELGIRLRAREARQFRAR